MSCKYFIRQNIWAGLALIAVIISSCQSESGTKTNQDEDELFFEDAEEIDTMHSEDVDTTKADEVYANYDEEDKFEDSSEIILGPKVPIDQRNSLLHSHNDYEQINPLFDALSYHYESVEADIYFEDGKLQVSHDGNNSIGTLDVLYLDPLQAIVDRNGSVYSNGAPFYLWIDIREEDRNLVGVLHKLLRRYPMLTRFTNSATALGPVTIILTGKGLGKIWYVNNYSVRFATRDDHDIKPRRGINDNRWLWYTIDWHSMFTWTGRGLIPEDEHAQLYALVATVHDQGLRLRIFGAPDDYAYWNEALAAQVDVIGTDRISELRQFVED